MSIISIFFFSLAAMFLVAAIVGIARFKRLGGFDEEKNRER
jgi:hypothetical protein